MVAVKKQRKLRIPEEDIEFVREVVMGKLGIQRVYLGWSDSQKRHPDLWLSYKDRIPLVTVTREWLKQDTLERHKRLVHELVCHHVLGMEHDETIGFSTYPSRDTYSRRVYRELVKV